MSGNDLPADRHDFRIVFLCTGNRARSVLAEWFLRQRLEGSAGFEITSRGTLDVRGAAPLPDAIAIAAERGLDLSAHRARPLLPGELEDADLVVGFEPFHVAAAVIDGGAAREVTFTLPELEELLARIPTPTGATPVERARAAVERAHLARVGQPWPPTGSIDDPLGQGHDAVTRIAAEIAVGVDRLGSTVLGTVATHR